MKQILRGDSALVARGFAHRFGLRVGLSAALVVCLGSLVGCGDGPKVFGENEDDNRHLMQHVRTSYLRAGQPIECTAVRIKSTTPISDALQRVEFEADATLVKGTYAPLDKGRMLESAGWNETAYVAALKQAADLPPDVRAQVEKLRPRIDGNTRFYVSEGNEGEKLKFEGRCTARFHVSSWTLNELELKELTTPSTAPKSKFATNGYKVSALQPNSLEVTGKDGEILIQGLVEAQQAFVASVTAETAKMAKLQTEATAKLLGIAVTGKTWTATLPDGNRPAQKWIIEFIEASDGDIFKALVRHPTDELRRSVFSGRVLTGNPPSISLEPLDNAKGPIYGGAYEVLTIRTGGDGELKLTVNDNVSGKLEPTPAVAAAKPESELWAELLKRIQPGTTWTGTARTGTDAAAAVKLTFVDMKPDGSYLRAVGESPGDPATTVVYEGIANRASVHGWPIVMKAIESYAVEAQKRDYFSADKSLLVLAVLDDRFIGHRGVDALQFTSSSKVEPWAGRDQVAARIFAPGVKLTGRLERSESSTEVDLTIAEVRDNGAYVRVLVQAKEDPYDCVVYEGKIPFQTALIDGYALTLNKRTSLNRSESLFRDETGTTLRLRMALDGSSVIGILTIGGEAQDTLSLKVDEARRATVDLATEPFAAHIRKVLVKNSQWRGSLRDLRESRSAEVMMRISDVNAADGITAEFTVPRTIGARAVYEGVFQLKDSDVNSYCATLKKMIGGKAEKSAMFDSNTGDDRRMKFTLAPDGVTLYVQTNSASGERLEQLTLRSVTINRPPSLLQPGAPGTVPGAAPGGTQTGIPGGAPGVPPAAAPAGTRPISGLLRPATP